METVIVNVGKTAQGYSASIDILPGWVLGMSGSFAEFKKELQESIDIYLEWAKKDGDEYPSVFDAKYKFEYKFILGESHTGIFNTVKHAVFEH